MLKGTAASAGYGIGNAVIIKDADLDYSALKFTTPENETSRLESAVEKFTEKTNELSERLARDAGEKEAEILKSHIEMINDPFMKSQMLDSVNSGSTAEASLDSVCKMYIDMFSNVDDEMTRQRASDIKDIRDDILKILLNVCETDLFSIPENSLS